MATNDLKHEASAHGIEDPSFNDSKLITESHDNYDTAASAAEEAALIRKLDLRLLPFVMLLYTLSILDRSNLGNAKLAGMDADLDISSKQYAWLGTIFYIACTAFPPSGVAVESWTCPRDLYADKGSHCRYSFPIHDLWVEAVPSVEMGSLCHFALGFHCHGASGRFQLGRTHDVSFLLGYCGGLVWTRCAIVPDIFLPKSQGWIQAW